MRTSIKRYHIFLWLLIPLIAVAEIVAQLSVDNAEPNDNNWTAAVDYIRSRKTADDLVIYTPAWQRQALMHTAGLLSNRDFGHFDYSRYANVYEITTSPEREPRVELEYTEIKEFDEISVVTWKNKSRADIAYDFIDNAPEGRTKFLVDSQYRQRYAISMMPGGDGHLEFSSVPLDGKFFGYAFIARTNFRREIYDKDGPLEFNIFLDENRVKSIIVNQGGAPLPFSVELPGEGEGDFRFELKAKGEFQHYGFGFVADVRR